MQGTRRDVRVLHLRVPRARDRGATGLEYGLMIAGGALVALIGVTTLGDQTAQVFQCMSDQFRSQGKADCGDGGPRGGPDNGPTSTTTSPDPGPTTDAPTGGTPTSISPSPTPSGSGSPSPSTSTPTP